MSDPNYRAVLLDQLVRHAYQWRPRAEFKLVSGKLSNEYLDCKLALSQPEALAALGRVVLALLNPSAMAIGGLTMGADPIAMSASQASAGTRHPLRWFSVRKEAKVHGQKKLIEGDVKPGEAVVVVDDVLTTGKSTLQALAACAEEGLKIAQVVVLVDRQESNGFENLLTEAAKLAGKEVPVVAVFKKSEIVEEWRRRNPHASAAQAASTHRTSAQD